MSNISVTIDAHKLEHRMSRLRLHEPTDKIEVFEHIGPLRFTGLTGLRISSTKWPPYDGCSRAYWDALKPQCEEDTTDPIPWYTVQKAFSWKYPKRRNGNLAYTEVRPSKTKHLKIFVSCNFEGLGQFDDTYIFPDLSLLERVMSVPAPGFSRVRGRLASFIGWPHYKNVSWINGDIAYARRTLLDHRVLDILGALSVLCKDGLFCGEVNSVCSGHEADFHVVKLAAEHLVPVP